MKYNQLIKAIDSTSQHLLGRAAAAVNQSLVLRNWIIGAYIVEFEQCGEDRAKYGEMLLARLSCDLKQRGVKGASRDMLERMRTCFACYPQIGEWISASAMRKSLPAIKSIAPPISASVMRKSIAEMTSVIPSSAMTKFNQDPPPPISSPVVRKSAGNITPLSSNAMLHFSWTHGQ